MSIISTFVNKTLGVLRLGNTWFSRLLASLVEAGRTHSYVETVNPSQSDTLHKEIKTIDFRVFKHEFENSVRLVLRPLYLTDVEVAVDTTEEPYWGKNGFGNTRISTHDSNQECYTFVNLSIVKPFFIPLMSLPYRQTDDLDTLAIELLEYLRLLPLRVRLVIFDRGFYHSRLIDYLENSRGHRPWPYLIFVPKNSKMQEYIQQTEGRLGVFKHKMNYKMKKSSWKPQTTIVVCKGIGENKEKKPIDWCFATNQRPSLNLVWIYKKRWNIETGYRIHDEATIKSKSSNPLIRYFYHLIGMVLVLVWRLNNYLKGHMVFKRYLKVVELRFVELVVKPPGEYHVA